jgi:DKNYY family protein
MLLGCTRNMPPNSLFDSAGYHVSDGKVYHLNAFPGRAFELSDADAAGFRALDSTYGGDKSTVFVNGHPHPDAAAASFELLNRPNFAEDSHVVYWSDGSVLSEDPAHFAIVSNADNYLFTRDGRTIHVNGNPIADADPPTFQVCTVLTPAMTDTSSISTSRSAGAELSPFRPLDGPYASDSARVYWMGKTIDGADPLTFRVLNADVECSADDGRAYYRQAVIADADPRTFPSDRAVTNCSEASMSFGQ